MRVLLINPNVSGDMTERIAAAARVHLPAAAELVTATASFGAEVIASRSAFAIAGHAALDAFARHAGGCDAVILACFGDPGLEALREIADVPVAGLLDASVRRCGELSQPFGIVTAGALWRPMLEERIATMDERGLLRGIETINVSGLEISRAPGQAIAVIDAAAARLAARGAEAVVLGGAAMVGLAGRLATPVTVIDCLEAAVAWFANAPEPAGRPLQSHVRTEGLSEPLSRLLAPR